jgi:heme exporter protein A
MMCLVNMLTIDNLSFAYEDTFVFKHLNFSLQSGKVFHLLGENGSGKTTLLKLIAGLYQPRHGAIKFTKPTNFQESIAFFGLDMGFHPALTVRQNIGFFPKVVALEKVELELAELHLSHKIDAIFSQLSLGQQQKIVLATLKHIDAALWLLDEPFANLDKQGEAWLWSVINAHLYKGGSVIFTAHHMPAQSGIATCQIS